MGTIVILLDDYDDGSADDVDPDYGHIVKLKL